MKWFKHDSSANSDAKLKRLRMKYGLQGYGLYWYILEMITGNSCTEKLTFELEHDAEILAFDTGIHFELVQEMMQYMVDLALFENNGGKITCLKLLKRLDQSMTSNKNTRALIYKAKLKNNLLENNESHDGVMTIPDAVMQDVDVDVDVDVDINNNVQFDTFWDLYDKKVNVAKCKNKFNKLKDSDKKLIFLNLPNYLAVTPDKQFRKDPLTYLNNEGWNDEIIKPALTGKPLKEFKTEEINWNSTGWSKPHAEFS